MNAKRELLEKIIDSVEKTKKRSPLVEQITNYVTINDCANATLAVGGSPVMADAPVDAEQMTEVSDSLVLNFGIVGEKSLETMINAGRVANKKNIKIVFDPVGVGATEFRKDAVKKILDKVHMSVIKGNVSEIIALSGKISNTKGVDSSDNSEDAIESAIFIANKYRCICAVTGKVDIITDGDHVVKVYNESEMLSFITGTGCMIASIIGSFLGATKDPLISSVTGILAMSVSGELAAKAEVVAKKGIGNYKTEIFNNLYKFNKDIILKNSKIEIEKIESRYSMYLVTDEKACKGKNFYDSIEKSIIGGAKVVQLREKNMSTRDFYNRALKLKEICKKHNTTFLINDRIDIAMSVDADGVHLGQSDMPITIAKKLIGYNKIVGISVSNLEEAIRAQEEGADYVGVGAIFSTDTKEDSEVVDIQVVKRMVESLHIPVLAIGGIKYENIEYLETTDVHGICVISDILNSQECDKKTMKIIKKFRKINNI
ncbi:hydroxyethylthiazole kinase [Peptostreptococcus faecalis]|uniref:hydroxyethylthiazole kinase n=1 Tax=Peptostreptococcus faecalis TaxID=2045015 RepID=UPI000C7B3856|nr:hydroxyethylthiazole kinase [Peptostreptococcus faecalis]